MMSYSISTGQTVSLETYRDLNLAAVLLKMFFRDLPRPIFPESMYPIIRQCPSTSEEDGDVACITYIRENILPAMESFSAVLVLSYVLSAPFMFASFVYYLTCSFRFIA